MRRTRTGDQALVRELNLSAVLHALRQRAPLSRAALAAATGLNKTTVSSLVQQLIELGLVVELGAARTDDVGRPGILLELNPAAGGMLGVGIGVDAVSIAATDFAGVIFWHTRWHVGSRHDQADVIPLTIRLLHDGVAACHARGWPVLGAGIGVPGLVDIASGVLLFAPNLGWRDAPLRAVLETEFGFPIYVDNEANLAALGETYFGAARGVHDLLYVYADVGLGGGVVHDGHLALGATGIGSEFGHMTMDVDGLPCNCGNRGCWETLASQEALFRRVREALAGGAPSRLVPLAAALTVGAVVDAAHAGDTVALAALDETGRYLGIGIANLINALNPEMVVIGGALAEASAFLLPAIERAIAASALRWSAAATRLVVAEHGADACLIGGAARVYDAILTHPLHVRCRQAAPPASAN